MILELFGAGSADFVEASIDFDIDATHEEAGHARHQRQVGVRVASEGFEAGDVRLDDVGVSVESEDQRDVHVATFGDHRVDRFDPAVVAGI